MEISVNLKLPKVKIERLEGSLQNIFLRLFLNRSAIFELNLVLYRVVYQKLQRFKRNWTTNKRWREYFITSATVNIGWTEMGQKTYFKIEPSIDTILTVTVHKGD